MEADKPQPTNMIDLIYRDPIRVPAINAQLFNGLLQTTETSTSAKNTTNKDRGAEVNVGFLKVGGASKTGDENQSQTREVRNPHVLETIDVINFLGSKVSTDLSSAKNGSLVLIKGLLTFVDPLIFKMATEAAFPTIKQNRHNPKSSANDGGNFLKSIDFPPLFCLSEEDKVFATGMLHISGLTDSIFGTQLLYAAEALEDVHVLGIKHTSKSLLPSNMHDALRMLPAAYKQLAQLFVPHEATVVSVICIYRRIQ